MADCPICIEPLRPEEKCALGRIQPHKCREYVSSMCPPHALRTFQTSFLIFDKKNHLDLFRDIVFLSNFFMMAEDPIFCKVVLEFFRLLILFRQNATLFLLLSPNSLVHKIDVKINKEDLDRIIHFGLEEVARVNDCNRRYIAFEIQRFQSYLPIIRQIQERVGDRFFIFLYNFFNASSDFFCRRI